MVQWEGQSFKSIFLSISTTCRVWFQEGGTGSGTDFVTYRQSFFLVVVYYRQSCGSYLAKNPADNRTVPITRRSHVA